MNGKEQSNSYIYLRANTRGGRLLSFSFLQEITLNNETKIIKNQSINCFKSKVDKNKNILGANIKILFICSKGNWE